MNNFIKEIIRKMLHPNKYSSEAYVNFLRRGGKDRQELYILRSH